MATQVIATSTYGFASARASAQAHFPWPKRFFRTIANAILESRQRQADRDIARLVEHAGGKFTDELDRRIEQRLVERSIL